MFYNTTAFILGPMLFMWYVNDCHLIINTSSIPCNVDVMF